MRSSTNLRAMCCIALLAASVGTATVSKADSPSAAQTIEFDIKPQSLTSALNAFALQSHQQILFTAEVALAQLLVGTGLSSSKSADGMVLVAPANAKEGKKSSSDPFRVAQVDQ